MATQVIPIEPQLERELETKAINWSDYARSVRVIDKVTHAKACDALTAIKDLRKAAEEHHRPVIDSAHKTHRAACAALNKIDQPLAEAETILKSGIGSFEIAQRRIQAEAERKAREEAERIIAEQREQEIEAAESEGASVEEIRVMAEAPMVIPAPRVQPTFQPAPGVTTVTGYKARVTDLRKLCRAVAEGVVAPTLVLPNETALNALARAQKGIMQVPGVVVEETATVRASGRR